MDVSLNLIDLQYLTNPFEMNKIMKQKEGSFLSKKDLEFYKKRIFKLTKDMLRGEKVNTKVNKAFEHYAQVCIDHFKFMDKMELIQGELKDVKQEKTSSKQAFNLIVAVFKRSCVFLCLFSRDVYSFLLTHEDITNNVIKLKKNVFFIL